MLVLLWRVLRRSAGTFLHASRAGRRRGGHPSAERRSRAAPEGESFVNRWIQLPIVRTLLRGVYADLAVLEDEVRRCHTDWTLVRPPRLVNRPLTGRYRTVIGGNVPRGRAMHHADVAHLMLAVLDDRATIRQMVGVAG